jgi:predicted nucleotide-binding protein
MSESPATAETVSNPKNVFVIHGRDERLRNGVFAFLRSIGLRPLEWSQIVDEVRKGSPFIGEVLDKGFEICQAVVCLLTPDDEARLRPHLRKDSEQSYDLELTPQARPNVLFEAGMALGIHRSRTILVEIGSLRPFSDVAGRHVLRFDNSPVARTSLANRLKAAGCQVDMSGTDWITAGEVKLTGSEKDTSQNP